MLLALCRVCPGWGARHVQGVGAWTLGSCTPEIKRGVGLLLATWPWAPFSTVSFFCKGLIIPASQVVRKRVHENTQLGT